MSIDLNWETVTGGPDGQELAHKIRDFIHTKFQSVSLPRFIKSVTVHDFEFGTIPPEVQLKDITDPLPDFYEENTDSPDSDSDSDGGHRDDTDAAHVPDELRAAAERRRRAGAAHLPPHINIPGSSSRGSTYPNDSSSPFPNVFTPGVPGGTSNLHYFHSQFASGLSGTQTPLAAVAGAHHMGNSWLDSGYGHSVSAPNLHQQFDRYGGGGGGGVDGYQRGHSRQTSQSSISIMDFNHNASTPSSPPVSGSAAGLGIGGLQHHPLREKHSVSTLAPTSAGTSRPPTRDAAGLVGVTIAENDGADAEDPGDEDDQRRFRERRVEDMQAVFHIKYAGDVKLLLTADILLDYPMPSFVGIPLRLSITGLTFDGVGVLARIRKRVHFCFLSPEDALAAVGGDENAENPTESGSTGAKMGSLLQEIRVESEIGQRESGKQSLKNVSKVERFVLEQVRRIFEEEFVYPSFWTFLV